MNLKVLRLTAMIVFLVVLICTLVYANIVRPTILVLHSYDDHYVWTREINVGLDRRLAAENWVSVRTHEMGTKGKSGNELNRAAKEAIRAIERLDPDVLIAVDDNAQSLVGQHYVDHPKVNIIFAGVNDSVKPYGYDGARNVSGIFEGKPLQFLLDIYPLLMDKNILGHKVLYLRDTSPSTQKDANRMNSFNWHPLDFIGSKSVATFAEWKNAVLNARHEADLLIVSGYRTLIRSIDDAERVSPSEVMRWTEALSPIPVIGLNLFNTYDGAAFSIGISPYEQGQAAADMAIDVLKNRKNAGTLAVRYPQEFVVAIREKAANKRGFKIPSVLRAFANATGNYLP